MGCGEIYYNRKPDGASCLDAAPARFLSSDEQPEASNAACDYTAGPVPWINWLLSVNTPGAAKGVSGLFCSSEWGP